MANETDPRQQILLKYAILVGLTPLIPLPLLDDVAQAYFERRMIERLAQAYQLSLSPEQLDQLGTSPPDPAGCVKGCLLNLLLYPIKKILRKIFFFLEIKRTIDLAATTYAKGHVIAHALDRRLCAPAGPHAPAAVRAAAERALVRVGTSPIELAIRHSFTRSTDLLKALVAQLFAALKRLSGRPDRQQVAEAVRAVEEQNDGSMGAVQEQVEKDLQKIPTSHFEKLEAATVEELERGVGA